MHRKNINGSGTFDTIIKNVESIENREFIGCSSTLTNEVFDLKEAVFSLSKVFKTLSFRFARGDGYSLNEESSLLWIKQYDILAKSMLEEALNGNIDHWLCLMNGEDYFGRFLSRAITKQRTLNRCDGGISRFSIDIDGNIYPCSAATCVSKMKIEEDLKEFSFKELTKQAHECEGCEFKCYCGGECSIELEKIGHPNYATCHLIQHLIELSFFLALTIEHDRPDVFAKLEDFMLEKQGRHKKDPELAKFLQEHSSLTFSEGKRMFDQLNKRY